MKHVKLVLGQTQTSVYLVIQREHINQIQKCALVMESMLLLIAPVAKIQTLIQTPW